MNPNRAKSAIIVLEKELKTFFLRKIIEIILFINLIFNFLIKNMDKNTINFFFTKRFFFSKYRCE